MWSFPSGTTENQVVSTSLTTFFMPITLLNPAKRTNFISAAIDSRRVHAFVFKFSANLRFYPNLFQMFQQNSA